MELEKLKLYLDFAKFFLGSVVVALVISWVNSGFKDREIAIEEQSYLAQFKDDALNEDIETRRRLAEYFSKVTLSVEARDRWGAYLLLLTNKQKEQATNEETIRDLQQRLKTKKDIDKSIEIKQQLKIAIKNSESLKRELNTASNKNMVSIGEKGWVSSIYLECPQSPIKIGITCRQTISHGLNLRSTPTVSRINKLGVITEGQYVRILAFSQSLKDWVNVEVVYSN